MKSVVLVISLFFLVCIAAINVSLLSQNNGDYGISIFLSLIISIGGSVPSIILLLFRSGIKWITLTKIVAFITMVTPAIVEEQRLDIPFREIYLYLNVLLIPLAIASIIAIHKKLALK